ncbi:MAG TPA: class F sortase, partial [Chloroflexota bacterium]
LPALSLGLALLAGCGLPPDEASTPAPASAPPAPAVSVSAEPPASVAPASASPSPSVAATPAATATPAPRPPMPKELLIPAIHVDAPVEHVATTPDGAMEAPHDWNDVAWFEPGYRPGEKGGAVIAGHLDSTTDRAVFWDLRLLKPGDTVQLKAADGSQRVFQVVGSETYPFDKAPIPKIFGPAEQPMLNLVTCDGTFDRGSKNYNQRLVVYTREV